MTDRLEHEQSMFDEEPQTRRSIVSEERGPYRRLSDTVQYSTETPGEMSAHSPHDLSAVREQGDPAQHRPVYSALPSIGVKKLIMADRA